jgi:tetratricopeptide (TPR) repeat protein
MRRLASCAMLLLMFASCRVRRARSDLEKGHYDDARTLLQEHLQKNPDDIEANFLLAQVDLYQGKVAAAKIRLDPIVSRNYSDLRLPASQLYRATVHSLEASGDTAAMGAAAVEAAHLNQLAASDMCDAVMGRAERERGKKWRPLTDAAMAIDSSCRDRGIALLQSWLEHYDVTNANVDDALEIAMALRDVRPNDTLEVARDLRTLARKLAAEDRFKAKELASHLAEINPMIGSEPETEYLQKKVGAIEVAAPVFTFEAPKDVSLETTLQTIKKVGDLLVAYHFRNASYPIPGSWDKLLAIIGAAPGTVPAYDGWGHQIRYDSDGKFARLISGGADGNIDGRDIVWENGFIVQTPEDFH